MYYIIGCGGVGSAIVPSFCLLKPPAEITLIDGDTLETKNLNRQLFDARQVGHEQGAGIGGQIPVPVHPGVVCPRQNPASTQRLADLPGGQPPDAAGGVGSVRRLLAVRPSSPPTKRIRRKPATTGGPGRERGVIPGFITRRSAVTTAAIRGPRPSAARAKPRTRIVSSSRPT